VTERVVRSSSRTPSRVSRRLIARLTPESVSPISSAALTKLPPSTTAASTLTPDKILPSNAIGLFLIFQSGII
jgi:hypothetical protein